MLHAKMDVGCMGGRPDADNHNGTEPRCVPRKRQMQEKKSTHGLPPQTYQGNNNNGNNERIEFVIARRKNI